MSRSSSSLVQTLFQSASRPKLSASLKCGMNGQTASYPVYWQPFCHGPHLLYLVTAFWMGLDGHFLAQSEKLQQPHIVPFVVVFQNLNHAHNSHATIYMKKNQDTANWHVPTLLLLVTKQVISEQWSPINLNDQLTANGKTTDSFQSPTRQVESPSMSMVCESNTFQLPMASDNLLCPQTPGESSAT